MQKITGITTIAYMYVKNIYINLICIMNKNGMAKKKIS